VFRERLYGAVSALAVTFLWSSSYILVKIGLNQLNISPLTLVTLRYAISSMCLLLLVFLKGFKIQNLKRNSILHFLVLGITGFSIAQGFQCLGLFYLPAVTVTFLLNFTPFFVLIFGLIMLNEKPSKLQVVGAIIIFIGAYIFFNNQLSKPNLLGLIVTLISGLGWGAYMVYARSTLVSTMMELLPTTAFSMSIGTLILLIATYFVEGITVIPLQGWIIVFWLGLVNTAIAFLLWNYALKRLKAFETSVIQNTMLVQIGLLSWVFLGEKIGLLQMVAIILVLSGVIIVQLRK
jgi:drug/metabolite transporter (DMT)-like permease